MYKKQSTAASVMENIYNAIVKLPKPIRRVCAVQLFAFMGWFPFLFYATTYVGQVMAYEIHGEPDNDVATRTGEFALLIYSIVAVSAGTLLPYLARRNIDLLSRRDEDEDEEAARLKKMVKDWKQEAARNGKPLRLPFMPFLLRNIWTGALLLFSLLTFSTFFITTVFQASVMIALVGICWAVACWVPFAIIMEFLKEMEEDALPKMPTRPPPDPASRRPSHSRTLSTPLLRTGVLPAERAPLLVRRRSFEEYEIAMAQFGPSTPVAGGTVLGIHNLSIVLPQFIVALVASAIFKLSDSHIDEDTTTHDTYYGKNGVAWVLRFGGLCTLVGAVIARMVPPTRTEREMRRLLAEMQEFKDDEGNP